MADLKTNAILTLAEVQSYLGLSAGVDEDVLKELVNGASQYIETFLGRVVKEQDDITEYFDGDEISDILQLQNFPITTLTSLQYDNGSFATPNWVAYDAGNYKAINETGEIYLNVVYSGIRNIKVVYKAGYALGSIPEDIKLACKMIVGGGYNKRKSDAMTGQSMAEARIDWGKVVTDEIKQLLLPYKNLNLI